MTTLTPSPHTHREHVLSSPDPRQANLAHACGARAGGGRFYFSPSQARRFEMLHAAGFHAVRRQDRWMFIRGSAMVRRGEALASARREQV